MRLLKTMSMLGVLAAFVLAAAAPANAMDYEGDQMFWGDTTIGPDDTVKGNVTITDGMLEVYGTVDGNVLQSGSIEESIAVFVDDGLVKGNIDENGEGDIIVTGEGTVEGNVYESGDHGVHVQGRSLVKGNVYESGDGTVFVGVEATVEGNIEED